MADQTPTAKLRTAAATLRTLANTAMPGPWLNLANGDRIVREVDHKVNGVYATYEYVIGEPVEHAGNAAWIAAVHPGLAEPLAAWLDWAANIARDHPWDLDYDGMPTLRWCTHCQDEETSCVQAVDRALAVARVINGGHE